MSIKKILFFSVIFLLTLSVFSQDSKTDSLLNAIEKSDADTARANLLNELSLRYINQNSYSLGLKFAGRSLQLSRELNYDNGKATALKNYALAHYYMGNFPAMKEYLLQALPIRKKSGPKKQIAGVHSNLGVAYWSMGDYVNAQRSYLDALKIAEEMKDKDGIATIELNVGILNWSQGKFREAISYYKKSLKTHQELDDKRGVANAYANMANAYHSLEQIDTALDYNMKALKLREELRDSSDIASSYINIANIYNYIKQYEKTKEFQQKALGINQRIGDKNGEALVLLNMGETFSELKDSKHAVEYMNKALLLAKKTFDLELQKNVFDGLTEVYSRIGKNDSALKYYRAFVKMRDSLVNEESIKKITQLQMQYEFDKQREQEALLQKQKDELAAAEYKWQSSIRNFFIAGFVLVLIAAIFIFKSLKQTRKANAIIAAQKLEVEFQKSIVDQKNKDMTDSINYAQKIQDAVFPSIEIQCKLFPESFILFKPRDIVSGDFYWFAEKNGKRFIAAADCTGHGVPGAFMSIIGNHLLNEIILGKGIFQPADILNHLHEGVRAALKQDEQQKQADGMDIALCCFDETNTMQFAGAHRPLYFISDGALKDIKADKFPIGGTDAHEDKKFTNHVSNVKRGDLIYISSDGYADQFGGTNGKKLMTKNFKELLLANSNLTMPEQEKILNSSIKKWKGAREQVDDILVIGIRV